MSTPVPDPFARLEPRDGLQIERVTQGTFVALYLTVVGGDTYWSLPAVADATTNPSACLLSIADLEQASISERGHLDRMQYVLEAVTRYVRTGGDLAELLRMIQQIQAHVPGTFLYPGYAYFTSVLQADNPPFWVHYFVEDRRPLDDTSLTVEWAEGQFINPPQPYASLWTHDGDLP